MRTLENIQDLKKLLLNSYTIYTYDYAGGFIINDWDIKPTRTIKK